MDNFKNYICKFEDNKLLKCDAERMIEIAYKSGYVDAWREALFFTDN